MSAHVTIFTGSHIMFFIFTQVFATFHFFLLLIKSIFIALGKVFAVSS